MQSQTPRQPDIDVSAGLNAYMETFDLWRKNFENAVRGFSGGSMSGMQQPSAPASMEQSMAAWQKSCLEPLEQWRKQCETAVRGFAGGNLNGMQMPGMPAGMDQSMTAWQKPFETFCQQLMSQQAELCQSFSQRLEEYMGMPAQAGQCKSLADLGQMQMAFLNKLISDCTDEMRRLGNPFAEFMASWTQQQQAQQAPPQQVPVAMAPVSDAKH
jgi:hypothetical protein